MVKFFAVRRTQSSAILSNSGGTESFRGQEIEPSETPAVLPGVAVAGAVVVAAVVVVLAKAVVAEFVVPATVVPKTAVAKVVAAESVAALGLLFDPRSPKMDKAGVVLLMLYDPRSLKKNPGTCDFPACDPKRFIATKVTSNKHNKQILSEQDLQQPSSGLPTSDARRSPGKPDQPKRFWNSQNNQV